MGALDKITLDQQKQFNINNAKYKKKLINYF